MNKIDMRLSHIEKNISKVACFVTVGLFGLATGTVAQILPDAGPALGWAYQQIENIDGRISKSKGEIMRGSVVPIACGKNYFSRAGCYRWTPDDSRFEAHCFRTSQRYFVDQNLNSPKFWLHGNISERLGFLGEFNAPTNAQKALGFKSEPNGGKLPISETYILEDTYYGVISEIYDCSPSPKLEPLILKTITTINPPKFPFEYILEDGARENCLLAEHFTLDSGVRYAFNRTQFYCLEVDTFANAKTIADNFRTAFSEKGARVSKFKYVDERNYYSASLFAKQLAFTGLKRADVQMSVVSPEEIQVFYKSMGSEPEIVAGKAAVVFAIDEMFERD